MIYKFTYYFSFTYPLIIDFDSLKSIETFDFKGFKLKIHPPYRTHAYNEDFRPIPKAYILPDGTPKSFGKYDKAAAYPVYNTDNSFAGYVHQRNHTYELTDQQKVTFPGISYPDPLPKHYPMDTIRVDSDKDFDKHSPRFTQDLMNHLRVLSGQWWIEQSNLNNSGFSIRGELNNTGYIFNDAYNTPLYPILRKNNGQPINLEIWTNAIKALANQEEPDIVRMLVLDATFNLSKNNLRNMVLDLAHALDISFNRFGLKYWVTKGENPDKFDRKIFIERYRTRHKNKYTFIPKLISDCTEEIVNRNYEKEFSDNHKQIEDFWKDYRNPVSHGKSVNPERATCYNFIEVCEHLIDWLENLL